MTMTETFNISAVDDVIATNRTSIDSGCNLDFDSSTEQSDNCNNIINTSVQNKCNQSTQTDITIDELDKLFNNLSLLSSNNELNENFFLGNNIKTKYFTGLHSYKLLFEIHKMIDPYLYVKAKLSTFQQLILTLMKLRLNFEYNYLAYRFVTLLIHIQV